uniref:Uncharacterized protein n=1 Tax=Spongospora subterranea TaxID=70186 RepID=A0A0H5QYS9_9EUKA|eukprot:CRZ00729.1 hypothetical protein [Spongospora subterranea]
MFFKTADGITNKDMVNLPAPESTIDDISEDDVSISSVGVPNAPSAHHRSISEGTKDDLRGRISKGNLGLALPQVQEDEAVDVNSGDLEDLSQLGSKGAQNIPDYQLEEDSRRGSDPNTENLDDVVLKSMGSFSDPTGRRLRR